MKTNQKSLRSSRNILRIDWSDTRFPDSAFLSGYLCAVSIPVFQDLLHNDRADTVNILRGGIKPKNLRFLSLGDSRPPIPLAAAWCSYFHLSILAGGLHPLFLYCPNIEELEMYLCPPFPKLHNRQPIRPIFHPLICPIIQERAVPKCHSSDMTPTETKRRQLCIGMFRVSAASCGELRRVK